MASLMPVAKQQYFDSNGVPLSGGKVYTYAAGTTSPLSTYSDKAGVTPNTNPVVLDSRGEATIFWGQAGYKVVLKDSTDATIWTQDNLYAVQDSSSMTFAQQLITATAGQTVFNLSISYTNGTNSLAVYMNGLRLASTDYTETSTTSVTLNTGATVGDELLFVAGDYAASTTGADLVTYTPAGTGAVATTVQAKLRESVSVKDFGAKGDGVTDDSTSIANALQASRLVYFPPGTYLTDTIRLNSSTDGAVLYGAGLGTIIKPKATATYGIQIEGTSGVSNMSGFKVRDMKIDMSLMANTSGVAGIYQRNAYGGVVDNLTVTSWGTTNKSLIIKDGAYTTQYSNCTFGYGSKIDIIGVSAPNQVTTITFVNCDGGYVTADWATAITIIGGAWQATGGTMLTLGTVVNFRVYATDIENFASYFSATGSTNSFVSRDNNFANISSGTYPYNAGATYPTFYTFHDGAGNNPIGNVGDGQQIMGITLGGGSATLSVNTLEYNVSDDGWVTFQGLLQVGTVTTPSGAVTITNLPRTVKSGNPGFSAITVVANGLTASATGSIVGFTSPGNTYFTLQMFSAGARSDIGALLQNNCTFIVSGKYRHA